MDVGDRLRYRLESLGVLGAAKALSLLPPGPGRWVSRGLGRLIGAAAARRTRLAEDNLRRAFPETGETQVRAWSRRLWGELGQAAWEFSRLGRLSPKEFQSAVDVRGLEHVQASYARGRGVLLFTAHMGNWEYISPSMTLAGIRVAMIARRIKNPHVDRWISRVRSRFGARIILHREAVRESLRWLRSGGVLGILFDQRITEGGMAVPFFGRPARTTALPALLALRVGCPVHPVLARREGRRLVIEYFPALDIPSGPSTPENYESLTRRFTEVIEGWIRRFPAQWLWIHNRWKP